MAATLFIDVDGVFHRPGTVSFNEDGTVSGEGAFQWLPHLLAVLEDFPDVRVLVHSSWRMSWETDEQLKAVLPPALASRVAGATPRELASRFASIQAYCECEQVEHFVILDDEPSAYPVGLEQLVVCDPQAGLSDTAVQERLRRALARALPAV
ncbi:HAD domain-containing protein [Ramlibacter alkalitolerans]|uniref:FCP1 homology domain-containing protein n=1 Tax=Ramlibacter alkalitolerans TaxID=2039631 RepID=A0ABS1JUE5_9BURK|nr:HAD domain-containing protein [Ramlibacter alkalitolerans]MBL0427878.1 hypothetical protein [Ramlibacter alkalitolerans]